MRIITATMYSQANPRYSNYEIEYKDDNKNVARVGNAYSPSGAAASAINLAIQVDEYIIFADKEVMDCIPKKMRNKLI